MVCCDHPCTQDICQLAHSLHALQLTPSPAVQMALLHAARVLVLRATSSRQAKRPSGAASADGSAAAATDDAHAAVIAEAAAMAAAVPGLLQAPPAALLQLQQAVLGWTAALLSSRAHGADLLNLSSDEGEWMRRCGAQASIWLHSRRSAVAWQA